jgi:hypothetical protein
LTTQTQKQDTKSKAKPKRPTHSVYKSPNGRKWPKGGISEISNRRHLRSVGDLEMLWTKSRWLAASTPQQGTNTLPNPTQIDNPTTKTTHKKQGEAKAPPSTSLRVPLLKNTRIVDIMQRAVSLFAKDTSNSTVKGLISGARVPSSFYELLKILA